jgi:hypothetical protein
MNVTIPYFISLYIGAIGSACIYASFFIMIFCWTNKLKRIDGTKFRSFHINIYSVYLIGISLSCVSNLIILEWYKALFDGLLACGYFFVYKPAKRMYEDNINDERQRI